MNAMSAEQASAPVTEDALRSVLVAGERPSSPARCSPR
jgi:ABC-2 type transport system permease protein